MPHILLAGTIATPPKAQPFPETGRPRCTTSIRVDGISAEVYPIVGYGDAVDDLAVLKVGDVVSITGELSQQTRKDDAGKYVIVGVSVEAKMIMPLARRSPNKLRTVQCARNSYA